MTTKIIKCSCGEDEFVKVYPKFNKHQVFCVNCGNTGQAMSTIDKAIAYWNKLSRFKSEFISKRFEITNTDTGFTRKITYLEAIEEFGKDEFVEIRCGLLPNIVAVEL